AHRRRRPAPQGRHAGDRRGQYTCRHDECGDSVRSRWIRRPGRRLRWPAGRRQFRRRQQPTVLSVNTPTPDAPDVIRVEGVTKVYHMGNQTVHALRGVDLRVKSGEMIAVMGHSGSGKSTLMNMLGCLDVPTSGDYYLDGVRVNGLSKNQLADLRNQKLGFVFQGFNLLARTSALENVELPLLYDRTGKRRDTRALAQRSLDRVGLGQRVDHH